MANSSQRPQQQTAFELLSTLLNSSERAAEISARIRIDELIDQSRHELGLKKPAFDRLMAGIELGRRIHEAKSRYEVPASLNSTAKAIEFCRVHFSRLIADAMQEEFHIVTLNTKNHVIKTHRITVGTLDASLVHPREVFRPAVRDAASSILLAHNHPSGDPEPSREDRQVTRRLEEAGTLIGINVLDHIVLAKGGCVSLRENS